MARVRITRLDVTAYQRGYARANLELGRLATTPTGRADAAHLIIRRISHNPNNPLDQGQMHALEDAIPAAWEAGHDAAEAHLAALPGPMVPAVLSALLNVTPDPNDDPMFDAGFRSGIRDALDSMLLRW